MRRKYTIYVWKHWDRSYNVEVMDTLKNCIYTKGSIKNLRSTKLNVELIQQALARCGAKSAVRLRYL